MILNARGTQGSQRREWAGAGPNPKCVRWLLILDGRDHEESAQARAAVRERHAIRPPLEGVHDHNVACGGRVLLCYSLAHHGGDLGCKVAAVQNV